MAQIKSGDMGGSSLGKMIGIAGGIASGNPLMIAGSVAGGSPLGKAANLTTTIQSIGKGKQAQPELAQGVDYDPSAMDRATDKANSAPPVMVAQALEHLKQPGILPPELAMSAVDHLLRAKHGHYDGLDSGDEQIA